MLPGLNDASSQLLLPDKRRLAEQGFVYVIVSCDDSCGPVKIGWALDPAARIRTLQTGTPHQLRLINVVPGDRRAEAAIHAQLADDRVRGEWFFGVRTREMVLLLEGAAAESVRFVEEHGVMPTELDVLEAIGVPPLPPKVVPLETAADDDADREFEAARAPAEPTSSDEVEYIIVGETAGPPPGPTGHITWQRPMGRKARWGRRGSMR